MEGSGSVVLADTEDIALLRDSARGLLERSWPHDNAVSLAENPAEMDRIWQEITKQGWPSIKLVPGEEGLLLAVLLMEELGRAACPVPFMDALLANDVLAACYRGEAAQIAEDVSTGSVIPAWIFGPSSGEVGGAGFEVGKVGQLCLHGRAAYVENASLATHFFVLTGRAGEIAVVTSGAGGVSVSRTPGLSRPALSSIQFDSVKPTTVLQTVEARTDALIPLARLLLLARSLGAATRGLDILNAYAKERVQFGQKIGQFQAIQHKLSNCLIGIEATRLAIRWAASESGIACDYANATAATIAGQNLRKVIMEIHHGFGGISFWEEHEMPRHFRRVHSDLTRLGGAYAARKELAGYLFGEAG